MPAATSGTAATPTLAVKGAVCFTCIGRLEKETRVTCTGCNRTCYCSPECQARDWRGESWGTAHEKLCEMFREMNAKLRVPEEGRRSWAEYRRLKLAEHETLSSTPGTTRNDQRLSAYQPYCASCYRTQSEQLDAGEGLELCSRCTLAHHCPACPTDAHRLICRTLTAVSANEAFLIHHYFQHHKVNFDMLTRTPRPSFRPISAVSNWLEYFTRVSDYPADFPDQLTADLEPRAPVPGLADWRFSAATVNLSRVLTVLAGLEAVLPDLAARETLVLHFIGAEDSEEQLVRTFEELLHLLPALRTLHCVLVGPQLDRRAEGEAHGERVAVAECCASCTAAQRTKSVELFDGLYHDFVGHSRYRKPDAAVAFHTGNTVEFCDEWGPTLEHLVGAEHATVFTTYNRIEMVHETTRLRGMGAHFAVEGEENKWRSMIPRVDGLEEKENDIFYENMFWYVVNGNGPRA